MKDASDYSGPDNRSMSRRYLEAIERHILAPLETSDISNSCFATCLLLFSAIDSLGKLLHEKRNSGSGERFKYFLGKLGSDYSAKEDQIWRLRNSLVHNALNVDTILSQAKDGQAYHLQQVDDLVFIQTRVFLSDFRKAFDNLVCEIEENESLSKEIECRLIAAPVSNIDWGMKEPRTTEPPDYIFK